MPQNNSPSANVASRPLRKSDLLAQAPLMPGQFRNQMQNQDVVQQSINAPQAGAPAYWRGRSFDGADRDPSTNNQPTTPMRNDVNEPRKGNYTPGQYSDMWGGIKAGVKGALSMSPFGAAINLMHRPDSPDMASLAPQPNVPVVPVPLASAGPLPVTTGQPQGFGMPLAKNVARDAAFLGTTFAFPGLGPLLAPTVSALASRVFDPSQRASGEHANDSMLQAAPIPSMGGGSIAEAFPKKAPQPKSAPAAPAPTRNPYDEHPTKTGPEMLRADVPPEPKKFEGPTDDELARFRRETGTRFNPLSINDKLSLERMRAGEETFDTKQANAYRKAHPNYRPGMYAKG